MASAIQDPHPDLPATVLSSRELTNSPMYRCFDQCSNGLAQKHFATYEKEMYDVYVGVMALE